MSRAGLRSIAALLPATLRGNDYFVEHYPDVVRAVAERGETPWKVDAPQDLSRLFDEEMVRHTADPFRGTTRRYVLGAGESLLDLECDAARTALGGAELSPEDIEHTLVSAFVPEQPGVGDACFLARALGLGGTAWNLETACTGAVAALDVAAALVTSGRSRHVLVVTGCNYSQTIDPRSVLSWTAGDGAAAFVVGAEGGAEILGSHGVHTAATAGMFCFEPTAEGLRMRAAPQAARTLRTTSLRYVQDCCAGALARAGLAVADVDVFVPSTPTAWFARFAARAIGVEHDRTIDGHPEHANIGPVLVPANLHLAARTGRVRDGDIVLLYAIGSTASAHAVVLRWRSDTAVC